MKAICNIGGLTESEQRCRSILESIQDGYFEVDLGGNLTFYNDALCDITGYHREELMGMNSRSYSLGENAQKLYHAFNRVYATGQPVKQFGWEILRKDGGKRYVEASISLIKNTQDKPAGFRGIVRDVTRDRKREEALRESEERYRRLVELTPDTIAVYCEGSIVFINPAGAKMFGVKKPDELMGVSMLGLMHPDSRDKFIPRITRTLVKGKPTPFIEEKLLRLDGSALDVELATIPFAHQGRPAVQVVARDISKRKQIEDKLRYLSLHDPLTGLYNRTYFEQELNRLEKGRQQQLGIIVCDVDGLKLVNDTMGHSCGDALLMAAAGVIKKSFREEDMVARIGGDEFAVLLPHADADTVEQGCRRIKESVFDHNQSNPRLSLSMSVGSAVRGEESGSIDTLFKEADNNMYHEKLHCSQIARQSIVQTLMETLEARDLITGGQGNRLQKLVCLMAETIGLSEKNIADIKLLAQFHDIGKVGVPEGILFKAGPLTKEEFSEIKRHSEIGHRTALSAPDLVPIAQWILKHHERWDGSGYPLGLRSEEIPLECRIMAIAEAFDAMTNPRPYRLPMSRPQALEELKRCAGTQFDPDLVKNFIELIESQDTAASQIE